VIPLSVCLSVARISQKVIDGLKYQILWNDRTNRLDFGPDPDPDPISIFPLFQH